ncbi:hypothetical protein D9M68_612180 [compost metagenome]
MAKRFSKRRFDGTVVHYDSEAEMLADRESQPRLFDFSLFHASYGFVAFLILGVVLSYSFGFLDSLPRWARFTSVLVFACTGGYVIGRLGQVLFYLFLVLLLLGILAAISALVWHFV